jgi:hypothetical protein
VSFPASVLHVQPPRKVRLRCGLLPHEPVRFLFYMFFFIWIGVSTFSGLSKINGFRHHRVQAWGEVVGKEVSGADEPVFVVRVKYRPEKNNMGKAYVCEDSVNARLYDDVYKIGSVVIVDYDSSDYETCRVPEADHFLDKYDVYYSNDNGVYYSNIGVRYVPQIFVAALLFLGFRRPLFERIFEYRLLKWGVAVSAVIATQEDYVFKRRRYSKVAYQFKDASGQEVMGARKGMPRMEAFGDKDVSRRAEVLENPIVLYDPKNSRRHRLYPLTSVKLLS